MTRGMRARGGAATRPFTQKLAGDVGDRLGVEHGVVALEQPGDARLVDLHLQAADAERAERRDAVARRAVVGHLDALDAERRDGVEVGGGAQARAPAHASRGTSMHAGRPGS